MEAGREAGRGSGSEGRRQGGNAGRQGAGIWKGGRRGEASAHTRHGVRARVMNRRDLSTQV